MPSPGDRLTRAERLLVSEDFRDVIGALITRGACQPRGKSPMQPHYKKHKHPARNTGTLRGGQSQFQKLSMKVANICLRREPTEAVFVLLAVSDLVIQSITQRDIRERITLEAIRAFARSLGPYHGREPSEVNWQDPE